MIADLGVLVVVHPPFLAQLDAQVHNLVAHVVQLALDAIGLIRVLATDAREIAADVVHLVLQPLNVGQRDVALAGVLGAALVLILRGHRSGQQRDRGKRHGGKRKCRDGLHSLHGPLLKRSGRSRPDLRQPMQNKRPRMPGRADAELEAQPF